MINEDDEIAISEMLQCIPQMKIEDLQDAKIVLLKLLETAEKRMLELNQKDENI